MAISEEDISFLYPDMKTALVGRFKEGVMVDARPAMVIAERCNDGIKEIKFSLPKPEAVVFSFKRNTRVRIHDPTIMDPYEKQFVYVGVTERGDNGLYARQDIKKNELVSYYSGTFHPLSEPTDPLVPMNLTGYERYFTNGIFNFDFLIYTIK